MNKTLYIRDDDAPIWDRARELAGEKLSPVIVTALKRFVTEREAELQHMERIVIEYADDTDGDRPVAKAFFGRWLITREEKLPFSTLTSRCHAVAVTAKGGVVVFQWKPVEGSHPPGTLATYPSFDIALEKATGAYGLEMRRALQEAMKRQGVMVEELDI